MQMCARGHRRESARAWFSLTRLFIISRICCISLSEATSTLTCDSRSELTFEHRSQPSETETDALLPISTSTGRGSVVSDSSRRRSTMPRVGFPSCSSAATAVPSLRPDGLSLSPILMGPATRASTRPGHPAKTTGTDAGSGKPIGMLPTRPGFSATTPTSMAHDVRRSTPTQPSAPL